MPQLATILVTLITERTAHAHCNKEPNDVHAGKWIAQVVVRERERLKAARETEETGPKAV